jgi:hypothetical protein
MTKGIVYFFKHVGIDPIKIGYTTKESPIERFNQLATYAPYGCEIVGFVQVENAKKTESSLHLKYSNKRLCGEWFDITIQEAQKELDFLRSKEESEIRNKFEIAFAKHLGIAETSNNPYVDLENAIFQILEPPISGDGEWLTATEIQHMLENKLSFKCISLKILGAKLRFHFGVPKHRERQSKYFVKVR